MLLIIFWGLVAKLTLISCDCDIGSLKLKDFNWNKVAVSVSTRFL